MRSTARKYGPYVAAVLFAAAVVAAGEVGLGSAATYALAGFFLVVLIVGGPLVALGLHSRERIYIVKAHEATVRAYHEVGEPSFTDLKVTFIAKGLKERSLGTKSPVVRPTNGTRPLRAL